MRLLNKYINTVVKRTTQSKGTEFVQGGRGHRGGRGRGNRGGRRNKPFKKEYCKDKEYFNCNKKRHPYTSFPEAEKDANDASSSSWFSYEKIVTKLTKDFKKMKNLIHSYSRYKSQTPSFLMTSMRKKIFTFRFYIGDSNSHN